jgi:hypothetical protein
MIDKPFSHRTESISRNQWLSEAGSRENAGIFLRGDTLRE